MQNETVKICSAASLNRTHNTGEHHPMLQSWWNFGCFWISFHPVPDCNFLFVVIIFFLVSYSPLMLPLSMNLWLWEKALKEGLARVNGGQVCQLLHPNKAALSFTKPQLITLQAISEQYCLTDSLISPSPFPYNQQHNDETWNKRHSDCTLPALRAKRSRVLLPHKVSKKMSWLLLVWSCFL